MLPPAVRSSSGGLAQKKRKTKKASGGAHSDVSGMVELPLSIELPPPVADMNWEGPEFLEKPHRDLDDAPPVFSVPLPPPDPGHSLSSYWETLGIVLPPPVDADDDGDDFDLGDEDVSNEDMGPQLPNKVPSPQELKGLKAQKQVAVEIYSPPRVLPMVKNVEPCCLSLDILTGWDFRDPVSRALSLDALDRFDVDMAVCSPPCTMFSALQRLFRNFEKMPPRVFQKKMTEAVMFVDHSMDICLRQIQRGKKFAFEHPASASSWRLPSVAALSQRPDVAKTSFDQCMLDLKAPSGKLFKKRTIVMSNSSWLMNRLKPYQCCKDHEHQEIIGQEKGKSRSWWAQHYPEPFCAILAQSAFEK